ncbi:MAG TPA: YhjD/YihY/BrkB family envelope integrity protein [Acidimicrobiia bacterium]
MTDAQPPSEAAPETTDESTDDAITQSRMERLKLEQARAVGRIQRAREQLEEKRPNSRLIDAALGAFERDVAAGGGVLAGAVAFRVFLFMIPYVYLIVVIFGLGASAASEDPGRLARDAGIGGLAAKAFAGIGDLSTGQRIFSFFVAAFALLLATRSLLKVLRIVHALVWHTIPGKPESANRAAGALVLLVTVALAISALIGTVRHVSVLVGILATVLFIAIPFAAWIFVSWHMPRAPDMPWTALIPGAAVFGIGIEVLHLVTVYWIATQVEHKTDTYGAIGFALALLLWAYLFGRLITSAAVINETLWARDVERRKARAVARVRRSPNRSGGVGHEAAGHDARDPARLGGEHRGGEREDQHVTGDERQDPRVETGFGAHGRDDQGELSPGHDRGGEVGGGHPPQP